MHPVCGKGVFAKEVLLESAVAQFCKRMEELHLDLGALRSLYMQGPAAQVACQYPVMLVSLAVHMSEVSWFGLSWFGLSEEKAVGVVSTVTCPGGGELAQGLQSLLMLLLASMLAFFCSVVSSMAGRKPAGTVLQ
jgi:hypothetical protein